MYNNDQNFNNNFNQNINQQINAVSNNSELVQPSFNNQNVNQINNNNYETLSEDVPPVLTPIMPLSNDNITEVPSLDVFNPENVMQTVLPQQNSTSLESENNLIQNEIVPEVNNDITSIESYQTQNAAEQQLNQTNPESMLATNTITNNVLQNNLATEQTNPSVLTEKIPIATTALQSTPDTYSFNNNQNLINSNNIISNVEVSSDELPSQTLENNIEIFNKNILSSEDIISNSITPEVEISDIKLSENQQQPENDIDKLGLDSSYEEPDMLEIMDLDNDESSDDSNQEKNLSSVEAVEKIRNLVSELKMTGYNISIEEFDFNEIFQLIIKIKK